MSPADAGAPLAVVSGGTRGIGLALNRRLGKPGHPVGGLYRADGAAGQLAGR